VVLSDFIVTWNPLRTWNQLGHDDFEGQKAAELKNNSALPNYRFGLKAHAELVRECVN